MDELDKRAIEFAEVILDGRKTVREVAKIVGYSKSTVHNYLTQRLPNADKELYIKVRGLLEDNKKIRHIRGGLATKLKFQTGFRF